MSKPKRKIAPDVVVQGKLNSSDKDFETIIKVIERYPSRNAAVLDGLRLLAKLTPKTVLESDSQTTLPTPILAQFDMLNERISLLFDKLNYLQAQGYSPQVINAVFDDSASAISDDLADEIRAQFLANNQ